MQLNGGFFGSMGMPGAMPSGATSFIPQGAVTPGSPNGLTSPPLSDSLMAALQKLSTIGQGFQGSNGGPSNLPPNSFSPWDNDPQQQQQQQAMAKPAAPGNPMATPPAGGSPSPLGGLTPDMLRSMLARLGIGGAPGR